MQFFDMKGRRPVLLPALLLMVVAAGNARGEDVQVTASVMLKEEYNDNIFFSSEDRTGALVSILTPRLEASFGHERGEAAVDMAVDGIMYADEIGLATAINHRYGARGAWSLTPLLRISADAEYAVNNRPDRDVENNGLVIDGVRRERQGYGAAAQYVFSEKTASAINYRFDEESFDRKEVPGSSSHSAGLTLTHDISQFVPQLKATVTGGFASYLLRDSKTDNYTLGVGIVYSFSETIEATASFGGRFTTSDFDAVDIDTGNMSRESRQGTGWIGRVSVTAKGEVDSGTLSFDRNVAISSSRLGTSEKNQISLSYRHAFTEAFSAYGTLAFAASRSDSGSTGGKIRDDVFQVNAGMRYDFNRDTSLDVWYGYASAAYRERDAFADSNVIVVSLNSRFPLFGK